MKKLKILFQCFTYFTILSAFIMINYFAFLLLYPFKIVKVNDIHAVNQINKIGESLLIYVDYCKYMNVSANVAPQLIDGVKYWLDNYQSNNPIGCNKIIFGRITIPSQIIPGTYKLRMNYEFKVNQFRTVNIQIESKPFEIVK